MDLGFSVEKFVPWTSGDSEKDSGGHRLQGEAGGGQGLCGRGDQAMPQQLRKSSQVKLAMCFMLGPYLHVIKLTLIYNNVPHSTVKDLKC